MYNGNTHTGLERERLQPRGHTQVESPSDSVYMAVVCGGVVVVFTRSRPVTRSRSPAYPARLSRLLRLTSIASTEYSRPLERFFAKVVCV